MFAIASISPTISEKQLLAKHISYLTKFLGQVDHNSSTKSALVMLEEVLRSQQKWQALAQIAPYRYKGQKNGDLKALHLQNQALKIHIDVSIVIEKVRHLLEEWSKRMPLDKYEIACVQVDLAGCLLYSSRSREEIDEAGDLMGQAYEYFVNTFGPDYPDTLRTRRLHADYYCFIDDFSTAIEMLMETFAGFESTMYGRPYDVLMCKWDLWNTYLLKLGWKGSIQPWSGDWEDYNKAKSILLDVLSGFEELFGPDHEYVLRVKEDMGVLEEFMDKSRDMYKASEDDGSECDGSQDHSSDEEGSADIYDTRATANASQKRNSSVMHRRSLWRRFRNRLSWPH